MMRIKPRKNGEGGAQDRIATMSKQTFLCAIWSKGLLFCAAPAAAYASELLAALGRAYKDRGSGIPCGAEQATVLTLTGLNGGTANGIGSISIWPRPQKKSQILRVSSVVRRLGPNSRKPPKRDAGRGFQGLSGRQNKLKRFGSRRIAINMNIHHLTLRRRENIDDDIEIAPSRRPHQLRDVQDQTWFRLSARSSGFW
jgi:hypothetical protein